MNPEDPNGPLVLTPEFVREAGASQEWKMIILHRWNALIRDAMMSTGGRRLSLREMTNEFTFLTVVVAWFANGGNITHAASRLRSNRKSVRERVRRWRVQYPRLVPSLVAAPDAAASPAGTPATSQEVSP